MNEPEIQSPGAPTRPAGDTPAIGKITDLSERARQLIQGEDNQGCFENPDVRGKYTGWCGDTMQIDLRLQDGRIQDARFETDGCWATVACGNAVTCLARAKTLEEALQITSQDVLALTGELPDDHRHCADLSVRTLRVTIDNALNRL